MKKVSILVSTIDSGGAEKQAVLLAIQLSKHTDVNLIVLYGGHTEYKGNVDLLTKSSVKVGRFDPQKDHETLIKSISLLDRKDYRLCIVGYGVLEAQIREWVELYGIKDRTDIHIKPNNVSELERNADIYISTSLFEGTSNSIMEALNWSLPVVATNVGDNDHLVIDGVNGYLHPIGDVTGLTTSLCKLLDSVELRNQMGVRSNQNLRENYSMEIFEKRYLDLIEGK